MPALSERRGVEKKLTQGCVMRVRGVIMEREMA
jgi:hypothetical protein